uniref:Uncharacterized protein n=1 Tax=Athene cunicularia TaxID=194338 RepID=A0A663NEZ8_ATHCN
MSPRIHKHLLQAQQGYKEMSEQAKMLLDQYTAEKEAAILRYKNELAQLQLRFDQAQSDILPLVRKYGVGRGRPVFILCTASAYPFSSLLTNPKVTRLVVNWTVLRHRDV